MGRILTLVRHAKSSWKGDGLSDFDRPLNDRGLKNAPQMGRRLANSNYKVEQIISSPAVRAITTATIIASEIGFGEQQIVKNAEIYEASLSALINLVTSLDDNFSRVMLVGHNPGLTVLFNFLSNAKIDNMPTCSIAQIQFDVDSWNSITEHSGELIEFDYPKKP
ncbi:MAG: histidine phosphatase family protein [Gammaproteobacteria bacterium]